MLAQLPSLSITLFDKTGCKFYSDRRKILWYVWCNKMTPRTFTLKHDGWLTICTTLVL